MFRFLDIYIYISKRIFDSMQKMEKIFANFDFREVCSTVKLDSLNFLLTNQKHELLPNLKLILNLMKSL